MPGHLHPSDGPRHRMSRAESAMHAALARGLPDGWHAWHSLRLRHGNDWEGEGDFVIADPARGVLVLEVKGGQVELRDGRWYQNGQLMDRSPRDQAHGFARHLAKALEARGAPVPPYGVACAFPNTEFSDAPTSGDLEGVVIGARELPWLGEVLPAVFERAVKAAPPPTPARNWLTALTGLWGQTWVPLVRLGDRAEDAAARALALDHDQLRILDHAGDLPRALVEGSAGSGKTVVARELCIRRARRGEHVLYTCFTDALAVAVDRLFEPERLHGARVRAVSIRGLACELLGVAPPAAGTEAADFWNTVSLEAACDGLPPPSGCPDLVVVDEAQDLAENDWTLVEALAGNRGLWAMHDERQRFWTDRPLPSAIAAAPRLKLLAQRRSPAPVAAFAELYAPGAPPPPPSRSRAPDPSVLRVVVVPPAEVLDRVRHEIESLVKEKVRPADIAVLSLAGKSRSQLVKTARLGTFELVPAHRPDDAHVVADTFLRFKGLERPFIIITELGQAQQSRYETRMHIALTRATAGVILVCDETALASDARLQALASTVTRPS